jgi:hypothetical protein
MRTMSRGRSGALAVAAAAVATGLTLPLAAPAQAQTMLRTYNGTASIVLDTYDYCGGSFGGQRRFVGTSRYKVGAQFITRTRRSAAGFVENNPFHWEFYAGRIGAAGSFQLGSATVVNTSGRDLAGNARDPRLLLNYWTTRLSGSSWSGRLVDDHRAEGAVYNTFFANNPIVPCRDLGATVFPFSIGVGTTVSGKVTGSRASFTISGGTYSGNYRFRIVFSG